MSGLFSSKFSVADLEGNDFLKKIYETKKLKLDENLQREKLQEEERKAQEKKERDDMEKWIRQIVRDEIAKIVKQEHQYAKKAYTGRK